MSAGGVRFAVADLLQAPVMAHGRNRQTVAEAAGLSTVPRINGTTESRNHETTPPGGGPSSTNGHAAAQRPHPLAGGPNPGGANSDGWLHRLMACPSWSGRRLDPEEELSLWVAAELRRLTRSGTLRAVWTRCPVEVRAGGKLAAMWQHLGRLLGVVPGCPDFLVLWGTGGGGIELKVERAQGDMLSTGRKRTYMRQGQKDFREWCVSNGVKHEVCRSVPEVTATLRRWGRLL